MTWDGRSVSPCETRPGSASRRRMPRGFDMTWDARAEMPSTAPPGSDSGVTPPEKHHDVGHTKRRTVRQRDLEALSAVATYKNSSRSGFRQAFLHDRMDNVWRGRRRHDCGGVVELVTIAVVPSHRSWR